MKSFIMSTLMVLFITACNNEKLVQLQFPAEVAGTPLACDQWYAGYDSAGDAQILGKGLPVLYPWPTLDQ